MTRRPPIHLVAALLALALAGGSSAQGTAPAAAPPAAASPIAATAPVAPTDRDAKRAEMARLEQEMAQLARRMGELGRELGEGHRKIVLRSDGAPRIGLGVVLGEAADGGTRIAAVTPGGPAAKAGLKSGDVIRSVHGRDVGRPADVLAALRGIQKGQSVNVGYLRDGRPLATAVTADELAGRQAIDLPAGSVREIRRAFRFRGMNLSSIDADLGRYFGTESGALLIASSDALPGLKSGDVITAIEGEAVESPREVMRALAARNAGETLTLRILRHRVAQDVELTLPEGRPIDFLPPPPPAPPAPPTPPTAPAAPSCGAPGVAI